MSLSLVAVLLGLLAAVSATDTHECGPLQRLKIKHQWNEAYGIHGIHREELAREIFHHMFEHAPKSRDLFGRVHGDNLWSPEFSAHMVRVLGGLDMCISLLTERETLDAQLEHLQEQHKERGIPNEYFDAMEVALHDVLPHYLEHHVHFDKYAWDACFEVIANGIKHHD